MRFEDSDDDDQLFPGVPLMVMIQLTTLPVIILVAPPVPTVHNITGFFPAKRQNNPRNSTTPFRRFISAYYALEPVSVSRPSWSGTSLRT